MSPHLHDPQPSAELLQLVFRVPLHLVSLLEVLVQLLDGDFVVHVPVLCQLHLLQDVVSIPTRLTKRQGSCSQLCLKKRIYILLRMDKLLY